MFEFFSMLIECIIDYCCPLDVPDQVNPPAHGGNNPHAIDGEIPLVEIDPIPAQDPQYIGNPPEFIGIPDAQHEIIDQPFNDNLSEITVDDQSFDEANLDDQSSISSDDEMS